MRVRLGADRAVLCQVDLASASILYRLPDDALVEGDATADPAGQL